MDVARSLPVRLPMQHDELLSSWLVRTALAHGCDPVTLTDLMWPGWRCWTQDVDRGLTQGRRLTLSRVSGLSLAIIDASTLTAVAQRVAVYPLTARATWPWVLALGARNVRRRGGLQWCPLCFRDTTVPHLKLSARLAWHTGCPVHGVRLLDRCHACGAPLEPHRTLAMGGTFVHCARCRADLRLAPTTAALHGAANFQATADQAVQDGTGWYGEISLPVPEWFDVCRYLLLILRRAAMGRSEKLADWLHVNGVDPRGFPSPATGLALELLPVTERAPLLAGLSTLMVSGPTKALLDAQRLGIRAATFRLRTQHVPETFEEIIRHLPDQVVRRKRRGGPRPGPRSRVAVSRKFARLKRKVA